MLARAELQSCAARLQSKQRDRIRCLFLESRADTKSLFCEASSFAGCAGVKLVISKARETENIQTSNHAPSASKGYQNPPFCAPTKALLSFPSIRARAPAARALSPPVTAHSQRAPWRGTTHQATRLPTDQSAPHRSRNDGKQTHAARRHVVRTVLLELLSHPPSQDSSISFNF